MNTASLFNISLTWAIKSESVKQDEPSWTEEIFTVTKRVPRRPPVYKIADYHGEELEGTFYEQVLQSIIKRDSDFCRIENVIKSRMCGKRREYL